MKVLVVSDADQIDTISTTLNARSMNELGYTLGEIGPRTSRWTVEWLPSSKCQIRDPRNPIDP